MAIPRTTLTPAALRKHLARSPSPLILLGLPRTWGWKAADLDALRELIGDESVPVCNGGVEEHMPFTRFLANPRGHVADTTLLDKCSPLSRALPEGAHLRSGNGEVRARMLLVGQERYGGWRRDEWDGIYTQLVGSRAFRLRREAEREAEGETEREAEGETGREAEGETELAPGESLLIPRNWAYASRSGDAGSLGVGVHAWFR